MSVGGRINSPHSAGLPDPKMELLEVANRVLLVLPVGTILLGAKSTPKPSPKVRHTPGRSGSQYNNRDSQRRLILSTGCG